MLLQYVLFVLASMTLVVGWETELGIQLQGRKLSTTYLWVAMILVTIGLSGRSEISVFVRWFSSCAPLLSFILAAVPFVVLRRCYFVLDEVFTSEHDDMEDVLVIACQHLLGTQLMMFRLLLWMGLKAENLVVIGKNYSSNATVCQKLRRLGCVLAPFSQSFANDQGFDGWFCEHTSRFIERELASRDLSRFRKIIILDDGGLLHECISRLSLDWDKVTGIEQTSSGWHRLQRSSMPFQWHSIARHDYKLRDEAVVVGRLCAERIEQHLRRRGKRDPLVLIMGLGAIGQQTACAMVNKGYRVVCTDIKSVPGDALAEPIKQSSTFLEYQEAMARLQDFEVIVGAAGEQVITPDLINHLHPGVSLLSISSSDREFPAVAFRTDPAGLVHSDYYLGARCLVNGGFPVTFYGNRHELAPRQIQMTIAMLALMLLAVSSGKSQVIPEELNRLWRKHQIA